MVKKYLNFVHGVSRGTLVRLGVVLVTSSFVAFLVVEAARFVGLLTNTYIGLITYLLFPSLFALGLILIPIGWRIRRRKTGKTTAELLAERFDTEDIKAGGVGNRLTRTIVLFTFINVVFLASASTLTLGFMDKASFCGTACHSVMNPEWVTYQQSPHSRVRCVDCHVGEGAGALIDSKLNGAWQMISVTFGLYERPIPTPVHQLRPARETCEKCHWPDKFYGSRLKTIIKYDLDSASTRKFTTLNMKIDPDAGDQEGGIHWHIAEQNEVRYASVNDEREEILWVDARQPDGTFKRYTNARLTGYDDDGQAARSIDCVDCHNRATHIYEYPEKAIDERIRKGMLDRSLPYLKREALAAITTDYPDKETGLKGIEDRFITSYQRNYPEIVSREMSKLQAQVEVLQAIYSRNIHPGMDITWGSYPSYIGHVGDGGCFRCHNEQMKAEDGSTVSYDCTNCHSILANEQVEPFKFLLPPDSSEVDFLMHQYLRDEFMGKFQTDTQIAH